MIHSELFNHTSGMQCNHTEDCMVRWVGDLLG